MSTPDLFLQERKVVSVLPAAFIERAYSYALPEGLDMPKVGTYVQIPLNNRKVFGIVWDHEQPPKKTKLKEILEVYSDLPPITAAQLQFIQRLADYTLSPLGAALKMSLSAPKAFEAEKGKVGYRLLFPSPPISGEIDLVSDKGALQDLEGAHPKKRIRQNAKHIQQFAKDMRRSPTEAEQKLWYQLKSNRLDGYRFRRQHPVPPYIVDLACLSEKLMIELDGSQHSESQNVTYDQKRTSFLQTQGWRVLRFWNTDIFQNLEGVLETILHELTSHSQKLETKYVEASPPLDLVTLSLTRSISPEIGGEGAIFTSKELKDRYGLTPTKIKTHIKNGTLQKTTIIPPPPCVNPDPSLASFGLSAEQSAAAEALIANIRKHSYACALLDGVTGSGKTEVYFEAVAEALIQEKQVLILLPEIALSNAFLDRFERRFGCAPALWHSALTPAQRRKTWRGVASSETKVIVGARSALHLPYQTLGLMIVDEEHDPAYKQEDNVIYNARDMAVLRAHIENIPICLASATPSLETIQNAWEGRYQHLKIPERYGGAQLPDIHVLDMREHKPKDAEHFIAAPLRSALEAALSRGDQGLLFLNRRGYAPLTLCRTCGHRFECPSCSAWLTEHKNRNLLLCHHCAYQMPYPPLCPACGDEGSLAACGPGVERIAEEIKEYFPDKIIEVLASDLAENNDELKATLARIKNNEVDLIIGTQIIAKGHHFPKLTCVGVIDADLGLEGGDLRAAEKTYHLLQQVAGRAGREAKEDDQAGQVFLQTWMPDNPVILALASGDRNQFFEAELSMREAANMPPYSRLASIIVSGIDHNMTQSVAQNIASAAPRSDTLTVLGPAPAPLARLRNKYRFRLLVIAHKNLNIQKTIKHWMESVKAPSSIRIAIDIDPQSFL